LLGRWNMLSSFFCILTLKGCLQWRYSEFLDAVEHRRIERVLFKKEGDMIQAVADDGRRALVVLPYDPSLIDRLVANEVDIQGTVICVICSGLCHVLVSIRHDNVLLLSAILPQ
jgi:hypothetical protein